jgi:hypothetical protein
MIHRMILRPDGQVVGGPPISVSPDVVKEWSDPGGIRSCGGRWAVYTAPDTDAIEVDSESDAVSDLYSLYAWNVFIAATVVQWPLWVTYIQ